MLVGSGGMKKVIRSSLTLEMLLTLSWYYIPVFFILTIAIFIYKGA